MALISSNRPLAKLLSAILVFYYIPAAYFYGWLAIPGIPVDFPSYYYAAWLTFAAGKSPYGMNTFRIFSEALGQRVNPYIYPPPSLLAFWPLAHLTLTNARTSFLVLSHLSFLGSIWLMLAKLTPLSTDRRLREITLILSLIYVLSFDAAFATISIGQVNLVALLFICLALTGIKTRSSSWLVALPLSIAILLKAYPVLLILPLMFRKQFRTVAVTFSFLAVFTAISVAVLPTGTWHDFLTEVLPAGGYASELVGGGYIWNQSLNAFVMRLTITTDFSQALLPYRSLARPLVTAIALAMLGTTALLSYTLSRQSNREKYGDDEMCAYLLIIFIVAPISWDHHLVYLLPAILVVIGRMICGSIRGPRAIALLACVYLMAWRLPLDNPAFRFGWWTLLISIKLFPVIVFWLYFIHRLYRSKSLSGHELISINHSILHNELDLA